MIVYNTTFVMELTTSQEFIAFLRTRYIPSILETGLLHEPRLVRVLSEAGEPEAVSLALQFVANSMLELEEYMASSGAKQGQMLIERFGERVVGFTTLMEQIDL